MIRTSTLSFRFLLGAAVAASVMHAAISSAHDCPAPVAPVRTPIIRVGDVFVAPTTVRARPAKLGERTIRERKPLRRFCQPGQRSVIEHGARDARTGERLPDRLLCGI